MSEVNAKDALLEKIRLHAEATQALVTEVRNHISEMGSLAQQVGGETADQFDAAMPVRWLHIGNTDMQQGFMALRRAVEAPTDY